MKITAQWQFTPKCRGVAARTPRLLPQHLPLTDLQPSPWPTSPHACSHTRASVLLTRTPGRGSGRLLVLAATRERSWLGGWQNKCLDEEEEGDIDA